MKQKVFSIAIDGPAGAGKSTVAREVAREMDALYLDTGAMYRTVGLYMQKNGISGSERIAQAVDRPEIQVRFIKGEQHMLLDGVDVTDQIRTPETSMMASRVSSVAAVRERMVSLQREIAGEHSVVMDGRDIGTCVLPNATLKVYLTASCEVRAQRRYQELVAAGKDESYEKVLSEIVERDYNDAHRAASPMRQAEDAVRVDSSDMTAEQVVKTIVDMAHRKIGAA